MFYGKAQVVLEFEPNLELQQLISKIPSVRYSSSTQMWYMDYDTKSYEALKALGYKIIIKKPGPTVSRANTSIDSYSESQAVLSQILSPKGIVRDADIPLTGKKIVMNNQQFQLKLPYNVSDIKFLKLLKHSYWNMQQKTWIIKATLANLEALQNEFHLWSKEAFMAHFELISMVENPMEIVLYNIEIRRL